ncbi:MAG: DUF305 domain-containing protein, partial [Micrococcales bacterium]|nr:DUF305 domain-containing protein [Micrococcales bacterium]
DNELVQLTGARGLEFDLLYLKGMIAHHKGAVTMAQTVLNSKNTEVKAIAKSIVASQNTQIVDMQALLEKLN